MKNKPELRHIAVEFEVRAEGDKQTVHGHAVTFNQLANIDGNFNEQFAPGAFAEYLRSGGDVVMLWNHNPDIVLGRMSAGTVRAFEDASGLAIEWDPPQSAAREVESIRRGDVKGMSVRFKLADPSKDQTWERRAGAIPTRTIKRASIVEVSPAAFPYYKGTNIEVRSSADVLDELNSAAPIEPPADNLTAIRQRFEFMHRQQ